jgi:hypothetical protein
MNPVSQYPLAVPFAKSVAISGSTAIVGADNMNNGDGAAYIYYGCTSATSTTCNDAHKVTLSGIESTQSYFGLSVAISGSTIVVSGSNAQVFIYYGCTSKFSLTCTSSNYGVLLGISTQSISIVGTIILVGTT